MKFKAFIFDLDGTLVNSEQDITDSINFSLSSQNFDTLTVEEARKKIGNGINKLVIDALPQKYKNNNKVIARTLELMAQKYSQSWKKNTCLYPKIANLLDQLMLNKIPMAILSNKPDPFVQEIVKFLISKWEFVTIMGARTSLPLKPNPQSTLEIIKKLNINAHDIAFVGDGDTDIKTALGAGIHPIAVTWGLRSVEELTQVGAKTFINNPLELLEYI